MSDFYSHLLLPSGHLQTLAGAFIPRQMAPDRAVQHRVSLDDGDQIVLHDDCPAVWQAGARIALLIHGLAGCHASSYMQRIAHKLNCRGVRTFRMNLRGCGTGLGLARLPYHSGRSDDAAAALRVISAICRGSPTTLIGFSLGGNISLKLLGESHADLPSNLDRAVAVCPPVDLKQCVDSLQRGVNRLYDRHFVRRLVEQIETQCRLLPDAPRLDGRKRPRGVFEFDEWFTAPVCGFGTAENYYRCCSSAQFVPAIRVPTLILAAADDPLIPSQAFTNLQLSSAVTLRMTRSGGHLGFIGRRNGDPDRHWMDWRVVEWADSSTPRQLL